MVIMANHMLTERIARVACDRWSCSIVAKPSRVQVIHAAVGGKLIIEYLQYFTQLKTAVRMAANNPNR